jgi:hypothetical protein
MLPGRGERRGVLRGRDRRVGLGGFGGVPVRGVRLLSAAGRA